jgi:hypothetical protein
MDQQIAFYKVITRSLVAVTVFAIVTTAATFFQNRRVDALEKRIDAIEGLQHEHKAP